MNTRFSFRLLLTTSLFCALSLGACRNKTRSPQTDLTEGVEPAAAVSTPAETFRPGQEEIEGMLAQRIGFRFDDAHLTPDARSALERKAAVLRGAPGIRLRLEGHADERGSADYNKRLGMRRAVSVKRYLVERGVNSDRLYVMSYGKEKPVAREHTESAWSLNRRVEFGIMSEPIATGR